MYRPDLQRRGTSPAVKWPVSEAEGRRTELSLHHTAKHSLRSPLLRDFFVTKLKKKKVSISSTSCVNFGLFTGQLDNRAHTDHSFYVLRTEQGAHTHKSSYRFLSFVGKHFYLDSQLPNQSNQNFNILFQLDIPRQQVNS